jgi:hypothetical protein
MTSNAVHIITFEEFQRTRRFIEKKSLALMQHEAKGVVKAGFPTQNYKRYLIQNRTFYCIKSDAFKEIIENYLVRAQNKFPEKFGTGNAMDVIEAIYNIKPLFTLEQFTEFLRNEQFAYIIESKDGEIVDKILRIDLFRKLDVNSSEGKEFTGGIFHAFKHFSINNLNLSTGKDIHEVINPEQILLLATEAFFIASGTHETPKKFISRIPLDEKYLLKFVFYFEENTGVYFIMTIHKERKTLPIHNP